LIKERAAIVKEISDKELYIALLDNGIGHIIFKKNCEITVGIQQRLVNTLKEWTRGKAIPCLYENEEGVTITKEARDNSVAMEAISPVCASAVVVTSAAYRLLANFYLKVNKPQKPYNVFSSKDNAIDWRLQFFLDKKAYQACYLLNISITLCLFNLTLNTL